MSTDAFDRNNRNSQRAGDWRSSRGNRTAVGEDGVERRLSDGRAITKGFRQSQGGIRMGQPSRQPSGLNEFFYRQEGYSPEQSRKMSRQLAERGYTKGFGGQGIELNRGMSDRERAQTAQTGGGKGGFKRVRDQYNTAAVGTGNRMDAKTGAITPLSKTRGGPDGTSAFARDKYGAAADEIAARRDFARGEAPVQFTKAPAGGFAGQESMRSQTTQPVISATKVNPYGSATATYGPRAPGQGGTMADPLTGKTVPMKDYLAQQSAVQDTKYGRMPTGAEYAQGKTDAGLSTIYDPKKIRSSMKKGKA